jgi:hypothetical protein
MRATIITLEPEVQIEGVSFEEAFGESSELKGRGRERRRKRRQERRMKRIRDRQERKRAKQEMRAEQQEARQLRKDKRKSRRVARKEMGADESEEEETKPTSTEEATTDSSSQENEPQGENVDNDSSGDADAEELGDNQDVNDEESSFDAETAGTESSFDDENYDSETSEAAGGFKRRGLKRPNPKNGQIGILRRRIRGLEIKLNRVSEMLKAGKLPSNKVAFYAKRLKAGSHTLSQMKNKLANMEKMQSQASSIPVKADLQPQLSQNKIVVPAKGADGEDTSMFDNDETSSFDGKAFVSKNKGILIGLGIGIVAILVLNKMKVFK